MLSYYKMQHGTDNTMKKRSIAIGRKLPMQFDTIFICINVNVGCLTSGYIGPLVHTIRPFAHKQPGLSFGDCPNGTHWPSNAQAVRKKETKLLFYIKLKLLLMFCEIMFVSYVWRFLLIYISATSSRSSYL